MADDKAKKTKIDLKARLQKSTLTGMTSPAAVPLPVPGASQPGLVPPPSDSGSGSAAPPPSSPTSTPVAAPSVPSVRPPVGIAPPPGISPGIPIPPFGPRPVQQPAAPAPKPTAAQQTIKVEMGEEIEQHRSTARRNAFLAALAGAIVGGVIGFVAGGASEKGGRVKEAAKGAGLLEKDVREAAKKMKDLDDALAEASTKLSNKTFPDDLAATLGGINVPFDATNFEGKYVGSLPSKVLRPLLSFTSAVQDVNKNKDLLKNTLSGAKDPINKAWAEDKDPMAGFSVLFSGSQGKVSAELVQNKEPFLWKNDFPASYTVVKLEGAKTAEKKVSRWVKGDLPGNDPQVIPVDPKSMAGTIPRWAGTGSAEWFRRLNEGILTIRVILNGNSDDPTRPVPGLLKDGDDLATELHKAAANQ
ncbi:MAG: formin [Byssovorax sp.]